MRSFVLAAGFASAVANGDKFDDFKQKFGRAYASTYEEEYRRKVFAENMALIDASNAMLGRSYTLGVTDFADLTFAEFKAKHLTGFVPAKTTSTLGAFQAPAGFVEDDAVDWSTKGAVTPVKNQAQCGSCWSFSATGALEGASFIAGRKLESLSEQMILDCDTGGSKCKGGSMDQAFGWVKTNGLCSEDGDSYKCADQSSPTCTDSKCPTNCTKVLAVGDVTAYTDVGQTEGALEAAVAKQPVSVAIEADKTVFQHYVSGILTDDACGEQLDHGVLAVGYGTDNGKKYWKVKNSWGTTFGESGYIRIEKGSAQDGGECGIRKMASFPTVKAAGSSDKFEAFKEKFGRAYATTYEEGYRRKVFIQNMALIDSHNLKGKSYTLGVTEFTDLTSDEFESKYLTGFIPKSKTSLDAFQAPVGFVEADAVDWSTKGAVTPVKNQAQCGSCWSFSATGALEGASFIAGRKLVSLSEQMILDCDTGGSKCKGGSMDQAFGWVKTNGLCSEDGDSYKCADQSSATCTNSKCPTNCTKVLAVGDVTAYTDVGQTEGALEAAVTKQPVSVAIEADKTVFQHYTSGVLTDDACGEQLDHGVLAVGYGTDNGKKYWKVKNSWGTTFGENGYIRIEKGDAAAGGECGIRKMASFPTVKAAGKEIIV